MDRNSYVNSSLLEIGFLKKMIQKMPVFDFSSPLNGTDMVSLQPFSGMPFSICSFENRKMLLVSGHKNFNFDRISAQAKMVTKNFVEKIRVDLLGEGYRSERAQRVPRYQRLRQQTESVRFPGCSEEDQLQVLAEFLLKL